MVVALEQGRRDLTIDEFVHLRLMLERLGVAREEATVGLVNRGDFAELTVAPLFERGHALTTLADSPIDRVRRIWHAVAPQARFRDAEAAYLAAGGDLEQKVGRRTRLDPIAVALVARQAWGRSLTEERDRRVAELAPSGTTPRVIQARRGHVTRQLLAELAQPLAEAKRRLRHRKGGR